MGLKFADGTSVDRYSDNLYINKRLTIRYLFAITEYITEKNLKWYIILFSAIACV